MAIDERTRHQLFLRPKEVLGGEEANTLMEQLPPLGWAEVATKTDLRSEAGLLRADTALPRTDVHELERRVDLRFELAEERMMRTVHEMASTLRTEMNAQTRLFLSAVVGSMLTLASVLLART